MKIKKIKLTGRQRSVLTLLGIGTFLLLSTVEYLIMSDLLTYDISIVATLDYSNISWLRAMSQWVFFLGLNILITSLIVSRHYRKYQVRYLTNVIHQKMDGNMDKINIKVNPTLQGTVNAINLLLANTTKLINDERELENSKDELITNVSHDIRTPLTSIIGYLGLIENAENLSTEDIFRYTHIAYSKSQQMQTLVNDLFDYTNTQQSDAVLNVTEFDMGQLLEQFAAEYELEAKRRGIEIISRTNPIVFKMSADTDKLGRVFNNLISNAFKYGEGAKHLWLEAIEKDNVAVIRISNDGKQIPQDALDQLFERFYRVEESRSKETGGTGLGLAIAQSMVQIHGGKITVESNEERTSFIIYLPLTATN
ncbi:two-component sensor histidine kinase [Companilactobacillus sp. RD055328]|uniref:sensor histidine kinase n=1 Tax=Companilactobacillus sp. RD055328 TaxID=2916634 RepID=UPI001FC85165|nr:HAMP domain-containing sensor histidine kinase [Companilactobacillus sp. RD055328]GKQ43469.1 two-component sensor histidine kinase [Companilactobacillus sp. RD055328]